MENLTLARLSSDFECYASNEPFSQFLDLKFIYVEVFESDTYVSDLQWVPRDGVVLDIGANVGMFSILVKKLKPGAKVIAFEPAPITIEALRKNVELHGLREVDVRAVAVGAEDEVSADFTYYPLAPGNSTRYPEQKSPLLAQGSSLVNVPVTTVSAALKRRPDITRVDLVKIDVEGAELDVLAGISEQDWSRIRSFVIEVDDLDNELCRVETVLKNHGYSVTVNRHPMVPDGTQLYMVHAIAQNYAIDDAASRVKM